jgi:hypothetical protein
LSKLPTTITVNETESHSMESVFSDYLKWQQKYEEFSQGRTNFQIEKFIALEDGTPAHNYVNTLYQTRVMRGEFMREVKRGIELERNFEYKWAEHLNKYGPDVPLTSKDENGNEKFIWYDLEKLEHDHTIIELKMSMKDKLQQLGTFNAILSKMEENNGGEFTKEQYENEAPEYWEKRFERQAIDDIIATRLGMNTGNTKSIRQALAPTILDNSVNQVKKDAFIEKLINGEFDPAEAITEGNKRISDLYAEMSKPALENKEPPVQKISKTTKDETKNDPYALDASTLAQLGISVK